MKKDLNALRQDRGKLVTDMRAMLDLASDADRDFSGEEDAQYETMDTALNAVDKLIKRQEKLDAADRDIAAAASISPRGDPVLDEDTGKPYLAGAKPFLATKEYTESFWKASRLHSSRVTGDIRAALEEGVDSEGGYLVPVEFDNQLVVALENFNEIRGWANVITTSSERRIPVETDDGVAAWLDEEAAYPESDSAFGQVILTAHKLGRIMKVSEELMRDAFFDMASYIANNYGRTFGYAEEAAFIAGDGTGKPTGIVPSAATGITAASATAITSDEVVDLYHALKRPYRANAVWGMNDLTLKLIRKLKTTEGQYLWQPGLQMGEPDLILGRPTIISDSVPAATTGLRSVFFGDLNFYTVADRSGREMQRLDELYAGTGQVGFRMNSRTDGKLTLAEAVKVITML